MFKKILILFVFALSIFTSSAFADLKSNAQAKLATAATKKTDVDALRSTYYGRETTLQGVYENLKADYEIWKTFNGADEDMEDLLDEVLYQVYMCYPAAVSMANPSYQDGCTQLTSATTANNTGNNTPWSGNLYNWYTQVEWPANNAVNNFDTSIGIFSAYAAPAYNNATYALDDANDYWLVIQ